MDAYEDTRNKTSHNGNEENMEDLVRCIHSLPDASLTLSILHHPRVLPEPPMAGRPST